METYGVKEDADYLYKQSITEANQEAFQIKETVITKFRLLIKFC